MAEGRDCTRRGVWRALVPAAVSLSLAACAQAPRETFDLASLSPSRAASSGGAAISVRQPTAVEPTSGDRVVVRDIDGSVSVLPGVQWSERLPALVQNRLIGALQRAGVPAGRIVLGANRALATDIRRFEIDVARNVAAVEIEASIVDETTGATRASRRVRAEAPAPEHTGAPAVHALAEAAKEALSRLAAWARSRV